MARGFPSCCLTALLLCVDFFHPVLTLSQANSTESSFAEDMVSSDTGHQSTQKTSVATMYESRMPVQRVPDTTTEYETSHKSHMPVQRVPDKTTEYQTSHKSHMPVQRVPDTTTEYQTSHKSHMPVQRVPDTTTEYQTSHKSHVPVQHVPDTTTEYQTSHKSHMPVQRVPEKTAKYQTSHESHMPVQHVPSANNRSKSNTENYIAVENVSSTPADYRATHDSQIPAERVSSSTGSYLITSKPFLNSTFENQTTIQRVQAASKSFEFHLTPGNLSFPSLLPHLPLSHNATGKAGISTDSTVYIKPGSSVHHSSQALALEATTSDHPSPCENASRVLNGTKGTILWAEHRNKCAQSVTWLVHVPASNGAVLLPTVLSLTEGNSLTIVHLGPREAHGRFKSSKYLFFKGKFTRLDPIIVRGEFVVTVEVPEVSMYKDILSSVNISYTAYNLSSLPTTAVDRTQIGSSIWMYNCSTSFPVPAALRCDGVKHCIDNEDEANCDYTRFGCGDWVPYRKYCLKLDVARQISLYLGQRAVTMPFEAEKECDKKYGASLASLPDDTGISLVGNMIRKSGALDAVIGLRKVKTLSAKLKHLYRYLWQWGPAGSPIAYEQVEIQRKGVMMGCVVLEVNPNLHLRPLLCVDPAHMPHGYVCMRPNPRDRATAPTPLTTMHLSAAAGSVVQILTKKHPDGSEIHILTKERLDGSEIHILTKERLDGSVIHILTKECSDGSVIHIFYKCRWDWKQSETDQLHATDNYGNSLVLANKFPMFSCRYGPPVHYTAVCDGLDDSADGSDETVCLLPRFLQERLDVFFCRNQQHIPGLKRCDAVEDCFDGSDEEDCRECSGVKCLGVGCVPIYYKSYFERCTRSNFPGVGLFLHKSDPPVVQLDGYGMSVFKRAMTANTTIDTEGTFLCSDGKYIPSYLLKNGEKDCWEGEDEDILVENLVCPGFYRCHISGNCLHPDFVCDGIHHCPNKDDERFCHIEYKHPPNCTCEGFACSCHALVLPLEGLFYYLRYLNLSGVFQPNISDIHSLELLQFLNISFCQLGTVSLGAMPQLSILDVSFNAVKGLPSLMLENLPSLTHLYISGNPLGSKLDSSFTAFCTQTSMTGLQHLIMTHLHVKEIKGNAFSALSQLVSLDMSHNDIENYNKDVLKGLTNLRLLLTDDPKLCCSFYHPTLVDCRAPVDELSSCSDLLRQDVFRVCLWALSLLSIVGNAGVLVYRLVFSTRKSSPTFRILVSNLCAADLLMGVYLMMIGAADAQFQGNYVANDKDWRHSSTCIAAGVLAFVSSEVSAFIICLITLDRFLVVCFPFKTQLHLNGLSCTVLSCMVWLCGFSLAAVPLILQLQFYEESGICLPLPITRHGFSGKSYAFGVFILLNFFLFLLIGAGQIAIFLAVRATSIAAGNKRQEQDLTIARRLFLVVFSDFCCWFPISVMGLMAFRGVPIPGQVNVWVVIFVMPLNSTLNPFLYTYNSLVKKRNRQKTKERNKRILGNLQTGSQTTSY